MPTGLIVTYAVIGYISILIIKKKKPIKTFTFFLSIDNLNQNDDSILSLNSSVAEYVEEDELLSKDADNKKNTLRN